MYIEFTVCYYKWLLSRELLLILFIWRWTCLKPKPFKFSQFGLVTLGMSLGSVLKVENCQRRFFKVGTGKTKILNLNSIRIQIRAFPINIWHFLLHGWLKDQDFSYLLAVLWKKVNIKLFPVIVHHIVLFRLEAKYKPDLKLNLDIWARILKIHSSLTVVLPLPMYASEMWIFHS
jgi:hypothetical protein